MGKSGSARAKAGGAAYGGAMSDHELRKDFNGSRRRVREVPPLIWSPYASGEPPEPLDRHDDDEEEEERLRQIELERIKALIEVAAENRNFKLMDAYEAHVEGARRNAAAHKLFQHAFLQFPTDIEITPESEREMLAQGVAFINRTYGGNAVFHARLDRDEKGRHGVDVFFAPRYAKTTAKGTEDWISLSKFSKELARERFGQRQKTVKNPKTKKFEPVFDKKTGKPVMVWNDSGYFQGRALQDAFFEHLRDDMGLKWAVRGERKKTRDDDWETPEQIGAKKDLQKAQEEAAKAERAARAAQAEIDDARAEAQRLAQEQQRATERAVEAQRRAAEAEGRQKAAESATEAAERRAEEIKQEARREAMADLEDLAQHGERLKDILRLRNACSGLDRAEVLETLTPTLTVASEEGVRLSKFPNDHPISLRQRFIEWWYELEQLCRDLLGIKDDLSQGMAKDLEEFQEALGVKAPDPLRMAKPQAQTRRSGPSGGLPR